ncbi:type II secretion system F family protein [Helicobacter cappadocius]|uniref:Type II secretion system F family protein n=1 Tax=Helicobacter cappadocius TaxID=3063998 RepID=A0AA90PRJ4_9HELI|nr:MULTISPECIES: type II secretion system F family protein [unclassified Helicobacter]MDO7253122.1 type II secretion system F family protein [Helicobacter sp. faydin-H75]MDP2538752.1 type II secretion system F family protein [Helicobacter sp. faydin-H76]
MKIFFLLCILYAIATIVSVIISIQRMKNIQSFMGIIDLSYPNLKSQKQKTSITKLIWQKNIWYFRNVYTRENGLIIKGFTIVCICLLLCILSNHLFLQFNIFLVILFGIFLGGYIANILHIKTIKNDFEKNFPEALVIIQGAVQSGNNITLALEDCANSINGVLADEFKTIVKSLNVGDDPSKIFANSYKRLPFGNYYFFLTSLLVSIKSGAKIKEVLSRLSSSTTKAKSMEKKKNAITSEVRMSSKITAAIPFAFLILMKFISPDNFEYIMNDPSGRYILYYFLTSEAIGMGIILFLMRKI